MRRSPRPGLAAAAAAAVAACGFFTELESVESAGDSTETGTERWDGSCTLADDRCVDQDRLDSCAASGELIEVDCGLLCAGLVNFTCTQLSTGQHACWCVEPGAQKVDSCTQLEACLFDCGSEVAGACGEQCFSRTTATTVRLFGALVHCAEAECESVCLDGPEACEACRQAALAGVYGGCGVERSVCDSDQNDEPDWP